LLLHRDHPTCIKQRFVSVILSSIFSTLFLTFWINANDWERISVWDYLRWLGIHSDAILEAIVFPLVLVIVLFIGPIVLTYDSILESFSLTSIKSNFSSLISWRNLFLGPLTEEYVFRACMCPLFLSSGFSFSTTVFVIPLFFGVAHLHHILQHADKRGKALLNAWFQVLFQLSYTTVFGSYTTFLFIRTGHLVAPFLAHSFCNMMGFPDFSLISSHPYKKLMIALTIAGVIAFFLLLFPLTNPKTYNSVYFQLCN